MSPVAFVGQCLHNKDLPLELVNPVENMFDSKFKDLIAKYKFVISFENGKLFSLIQSFILNILCFCKNF